jgi:succinylglutamic semialdehyde dehydrogenase
VLGRFSFSSTAVDDAVGAARDALAAWDATPVDDRAGAVRRFADLLEESGEDIAVLVTRETGKPLWESREEVTSAVRVARLLATEGPKSLRVKMLREGSAWSDMRPHGVVGIITPYVFPLVIPVLHILAALVTGNTVVFKPSKFAPGVGQAIAERVDRCRLPRGAFNMVQGSGAAVGHRVATHPGIDALLFAGSHSTATAIRRATADRPELATVFQTGGKGSAIVAGDADLERAAYDLAVSAFATTGQRHNSTARVFAVREVFDTLADRLATRSRELVIGYGFDEGVFLGPMISDAHRARCRRYTKELVADGHTPILEGGAANVEGRRGYYVRPSIHWVGSGAFLKDEPIGPIAQLYCVDDIDEAVALHERTSFRSATSLFTSDATLVESLSTRLSTGCINVNRGTIGSSLRLPAVGRGRSSNGIPGDLDLLTFLTLPRATLVDPRPFDASRWVPGTGTIHKPGEAG